MNNLNFKKIGIIGGLGPMATKDLFEWIIKLTPANQDQDHIPVLINNIPQTPDRTAFILGEGEDPRSNLIQAAQELEMCGATILAIPCNTAHAFIEDIQASLSKAKILDMIEITKSHVDQLSEKLGFKPIVGLLATTGTIQTNLYQLYFPGYKFVVPSSEDQDNLVMEAIYGEKGIKAGYTKNNKEKLTRAIQHLKQKGADIVILGCTEISYVMRSKKQYGVLMVNPLSLLAKRLIKESLMVNKQNIEKISAFMLE